MTPEDEGRKKFIRYYRILAVVLGILGATLLTLSIISVIKHNGYGVDGNGIPFFAGGFIVGITVLLSACVCVCVLTKAPNADSDEEKGKLKCAIGCHFRLSFYSILIFGAGTAFAGFGGFLNSSLRDEHDEYYNFKQKYAAAILALCIISLFVTIFSVYTICTYGSYFEVTKNSRGAIIETQNSGIGNAVITQSLTQIFGNYQTNATGFGMGSASTNQIRQLREQNWILQEPLDLQRQLQQNQNPYQYQYGGGCYPSPPPSYEFSGGRYSPPPSYHLYSVGTVDIYY